MAQELQNQPPSAPPPGDKPPKARGLLWRILAVAVILAAMVAVAHYLRHPARFGGAEGRAGADAAKGEDPFSVANGDAGGAARAEEGRSPSRVFDKQALADLRAHMAGIVMHAADEEGPYNDPANQDAESRRQFLAGVFGLPADYPRNKVPEDLAPKDARVLAVFENPEGNGARMAILRVPGDIHQALSAVHNQYVAAGWKVPEQADPSAQTDQGWLMRFTKGRSERIVYARPRQSGGETLVAVYDEPH